ncbi:MAG TPA: hypothetical protein DD415_01920 [Clostridiales bacterium]|nr:hypothetical protein [Clostridiales bacterium]
MLNFLVKFFTANGYVFEMIVVVVIFAYFFEKRKLFWLRLVLCIAVSFGLSIAWNFCLEALSVYGWGKIVCNIIKYIVSFFVVFGGILFCKRTSFGGALFSSIGAMATQHISYRVFAIILAICKMPYDNVGSFFIALSVAFAVYVIVYFLLVRKVRKQPEQCFENKMNIVLGGILILFAIILQFLVEPYAPMEEQPLLFIYLSLYTIICAVCTLLLEYGFFTHKKLAYDNAILDHLVHTQEEQYRNSKDNIEMINIKCHDMKHQMSKIAGGLNPEAVKEMEDIISIYDLSLKTGNEILDIFLAEKKLQCERNNVNLDCIVNGSCLQFMQPSDIYSLFGNALDNAMEAVCKLPEKEKRIIGLSVTTRLNMAIIHTENFYDGILEFQSELPVTTKEDTRFHGFGMRSIKKVVEKYNGSISIVAENGIFNLNITIPLDRLEVQ